MCSVGWWHLFLSQNIVRFLLLQQKRQQVSECCNLHILCHSGALEHILKVFSILKIILKCKSLLLVQSDMTHQCHRVKSCLKREIWPLHLDMLICNPKIYVRLFHLILWDNFLLKLCLMRLSTCCITPLHNIIILLLCVQFVLLPLLVVLVAYQEGSFSGHLNHTPVLALDMAYAVDFWCLITKLVQDFI